MTEGDKTAVAPRSPLTPPPVYEPFVRALEELVAVASQGHRPDSPFFNPSDAWLLARMRIFQDLSPEERERLLREWEEIRREWEQAEREGRPARRAGPDVAVRLDTGGLAFFSQLGTARRPDLTQYFVDGFLPNRSATLFGYESQRLFAEVLPFIAQALRAAFRRGDTVVQMDRAIGDVPGRRFHARQLLYGTRYLHLPYMWRMLTFDLPPEERTRPPDILEVSLPHWLEDLDLPPALKARIKEAGLTQLVLKAPTWGLSLHLGFDYMGEHKMGPLSIAMFKVKERNGLALQAALSVARVTLLDGSLSHTAMVTVGPSLHGKSTLTILLDVEGSDLAERLGIRRAPKEGVYPMNDDIVLLQPLPQPLMAEVGGRRIRIPYAIDGTEDSFYAVPSGLTRQDDPITYDALRGTPEAPNPQETLENVPVDPLTGRPDFSRNPIRNMRMILSRRRLIRRKGVEDLLELITGGREREAVHVPLDRVDRILWQAVMRENTVNPPLRRLRPEQYVRVLMYGEAVQMGAAAGALGKPYVEYFSDPFIIGLEDENANLLHHILQEFAKGGVRQEFYVFNTGGIGAETPEEMRGPRYRKIPRELTLLLQEAVLRGAVRFEYDEVLGSEVAVAILDREGREVLSLREEWLPRTLYGEEEYRERVQALLRRRYYGRDAQDRQGVLRYTKVSEAILDIADIPPPLTERELAWLLSFYWHLDGAYNTLAEAVEHRQEGMRPPPHLLRLLQRKYEEGLAQGLTLPPSARTLLPLLGLTPRQPPRPEGNPAARKAPGEEA